jgi:hypothetical protein
LTVAAAFHCSRTSPTIVAAWSLKLGMALQRPGVAVAVEMLQKPLRKMADDPAASGP